MSQTLPRPGGQDITIIGAGIIGLCSAIELPQKGFQVTIIDKAEPGQGASYGNAGIISPWSIVPQSLPGLWRKVPGWLLDPLGPVAVSPRYLPRMAYWGTRFLLQGRRTQVEKNSQAMASLISNCIPLYQQLLADTGAQDLLSDSYYVHAFRNEKDANLNSLDYQIRIKNGADIECYNGQQLRQLEPALSTDFAAAIVIKGQARLTNPGRLGKVLANKVQRLGGKFIQHEVGNIRPSERGGWDCFYDGKSHPSSQLLVAAGAWSVDLLRPLGVKVLMENERGYHISYPDVDMQLNNSIMDADMQFVASQMEGGLRIAGTAEFDDKNAPPNPQRVAGLANLANKMFPDLGQSDFQSWVGVRPSLPDSLPCLGKVDGLPGLHVAFGHSHYGMMMAPQSAKLIAQLITHEIDEKLLNDFRLNRF